MKEIEIDRARWEKRKSGHVWVIGGLALFALITIFQMATELRGVVHVWPITSEALRDIAISGEIDPEMVFSGHEVRFIRSYSRIAGGAARLIAIAVLLVVIRFEFAQTSRMWSYIDSNVKNPGDDSPSSS